jgi:hypothetical protein
MLNTIDVLSGKIDCFLEISLFVLYFFFRLDSHENEMIDFRFLYRLDNFAAKKSKQYFFF